jgi:hypothetical protein
MPALEDSFDEDERGELITESPAEPVMKSWFDTRDLMAVAGISNATVQNWFKRNVLQKLGPGQHKPGQGRSRIYTAYEIVRLCLMKHLTEVLPVETAFGISHALKDMWDKGRGAHESFAEEPGIRSWLVVMRAALWPTGRPASKVRSGDHLAVWVVDRRGKESELLATLNAIRPSEPVIVLDLGGLLSKTMTELRKRSSRR